MKSLNINVVMSWEYGLAIFLFGLFLIIYGVRQDNKKDDDFTKVPLIKPTTKIMFGGIMMIFGAITGFIATVETGLPWVGFFCAALGGSVLALLFAIVTQIFKSNQVASGLALTLFGLGLSSLIGHSYTGIKPVSFPTLSIPILADIPFLGTVFFQHDPIVYFSVVLVGCVFLVFRYMRIGLILRAVGENHDSARSLGYNVVLWPDDLKEKDINDMIISGKTKDEIQIIINKNSYQGNMAKIRFTTWRRRNA